MRYICIHDSRLILQKTGGHALNLQKTGEHVTRDCVIWTDIGTNPDDMLALLMALRSPNLFTQGVLTCDDEEEYRAQLVKILLQVEGKVLVSVGMGCGNASLLGKKRDYLGPKFPYRDVFEESGALLGRIAQEKKRIRILTLGPLSDFARALREYASLASHVDLWIAMGGAMEREEEYNFCSDLEAVQFVLKQPFPKRLIPVDLTRQFYLEEHEFPRLCLPPILKDYFFNQWREWKRYSERDKLYLHDPLAVAALLDLDSFSYKKGRVVLDSVAGTGFSKFVEDPQSDLEVAVGVDRGAFFELFYGLLGA